MDYQNITLLIITTAAAALSLLTERVPIFRLWWREKLDELYSPEEADTIRLGFQVVLTVTIAMAIYFARAYGLAGGGAIESRTFLYALGSAVIAVLANQGVFHVQRRYFGGEK